jgi:hypothetical protein
MPAAADLKAELAAIERSVDDERYQPGPWQMLVDQVRHLPPAERAELASDLTRVSDKLHRRRHRYVIGATAALVIESIAAVVGALMLADALASDSNLTALIALAIMASTFQPILKIAVATAFGVSYDYAYLYGYFEPRFKMAFGSYLAAPVVGRILLHLAGMVGSPLAAWIVIRIASGMLPTAVSVAWWVFWITVLVNVAAFASAMSGRRRVGPIKAIDSSGGMAGIELRHALGLSTR